MRDNAHGLIHVGLKVHKIWAVILVLDYSLDENSQDTFQELKLGYKINQTSHCPKQKERIFTRSNYFVYITTSSAAMRFTIIAVAAFVGLAAHAHAYADGDTDAYSCAHQSQVKPTEVQCVNTLGAPCGSEYGPCCEEFYCYVSVTMVFEISLLEITDR